ncbi:MAG TPA: alpha-amylase family glycosyl hydrolase [Tianweitania sediminis]|nr:alpha-amylase family glycosyl hydrolase [Tianweitania sediminis]
MSKWWRHGTIYQIYPRSFQDSDGDGIGDLRGIRRRIPYLAGLGVNAIWLSPIFQSPMADFGYDISDYRAIDPIFGDMADFDRLLEEAHDAGLKLLLDFVPNHTSDQHAWFLESRSSRDNPKRDWYIWCDPAPDGGPPNNWISNFGGPAWTLDEATGQYYYHAFLKQQPDLNWRNPELRRAMLDTLRFWLDKGVDGFRVDVIWHLIKDDKFRDNPPNPFYRPGQPDIDRNLQVHSADQEEVHEVIAEMRSVIDSYPERLLIGEIYLPVEKLMTYYGRSGEGVHLPFNFQLIQSPWQADALAKLIDDYEAALPEDGWPNWVLSNHDQPRIAARVGAAQARVATMLLLTLRGTPTLYYGDELAIGKVEIPPERIRDPWAANEPSAAFLRDSSRTPMQWDGSEHAGFSQSEPWLPLSGDWQQRNVDAAAADSDSMLAFTRKLLELRQKEDILQEGSYSLLFSRGSVLAFERKLEGEVIGVVLNLSAEPTEVDLPPQLAAGKLLIAAQDADAPQELARTVTLAGDQGLVIRAAKEEIRS